MGQLEAMSHTPLTVLMPPGYDCVTVYNVTEAVLKITTTCHTRDLRKLVQSSKQLCLLCHEIYQVPPYSVDFKAPGEL